MKYLTNSGLSYFLNKIKAYIASQLNSKASAIHTHTKSDIIDLPNGYVVDSTLDGTSSNAIANSAVSNALDGKSNTGHTHTKSQITDFPTIPTNTNQLTNGAGFITSSGSCNYANSAGSAGSATTAETVNTSVAADSSKALVYSSMADNDFCRIMCGGASNAGYMEIATADDGDEPIYVRQYTGVFGSITRTLTLLDGSGNTQFPGTVTAPTFSGNLNGNCSGSAGSVAWSNVSGRPSSLVPVGSYIQFAGSQAPEGFLVCNGGEISRTTYSALFAVIGTTYGSGDGSTTFNLPNLTDRFLQGSTTSGTVKNAGLPNLRGIADGSVDTWTDKSTKSGVFSDSVYRAEIDAENESIHDAGGDWEYILDFNASKSNSIYGNSSTVQPPALTCLICIKY